MYITANWHFPTSNDSRTRIHDIPIIEFIRLHYARDPMSTDDTDESKMLQDRIMAAASSGAALRIIGGDSKAFYGRAASGEPLPISGHRGVVSYEPTELVLTARAGTPLNEIETLLGQHKQMLPFEPPHFGDKATLGGAVACGLSGPRRPFCGSTRDFVLGVKILNGKGEILQFGGQVMKNVAGYDVSRLMCGALGSLGVLLEISIKVLPVPVREVTLSQDMSAPEAIAAMSAWSAKPLPLSALCHDGQRLHIRLSGASSAVSATRARLGGEEHGESAAFWSDLREHRLDFFAADSPLWRIAVAPNTPELKLPGKWILDWGGAQRWLRTSVSDEAIHKAALQAGGHASIFRGGNRGGEVFQTPAPSIMALHQRLKDAFDPLRLLNPGRLYADL